MNTEKKAFTLNGLLSLVKETYREINDAQADEWLRYQVARSTTEDDFIASQMWLQMEDSRTRAIVVRFIMEVSDSHPLVAAALWGSGGVGLRSSIGQIWVILEDMETRSLNVTHFPRTFHEWDDLARTWLWCEEYWDVLRENARKNAYTFGYKGDVPPRRRN